MHASVYTFMHLYIILIRQAGFHTAKTNTKMKKPLVPSARLLLLMSGAVQCVSVPVYNTSSDCFTLYFGDAKKCPSLQLSPLQHLPCSIEDKMVIQHPTFYFGHGYFYTSCRLCPGTQEPCSRPACRVGLC